MLIELRAKMSLVFYDIGWLILYYKRFSGFVFFGGWEHSLLNEEKEEYIL
jgi:hypothetical protein